jgi:RNA polymerase sigma-70 factor (ECF subfamily)
VDADELDARTRALIERGEIDRATEKVLRAYGPELARWLRSMLPVEADAHEAFSRLSEELWKSLRRFDGRCSVRTWCYILARSAATHVRAQPRRDRELLVSTVPSILHAMTHVWSASLGDAVRARDVYVEIRQALDADDQILLALRVDRDLSWREIAYVLLGEDAGDDEVTRRAAALRKQFERVKERLRELAAARMES